MDTDKTGTANDGHAAVIAANRQWAEQAFGSEGSLPFSFVYGGRSSPSFIGGWRREVRDETSREGLLRRTLTLSDPETGLEVRAVCTIYTDTAGVDWTLYFTNRGERDTPILEQVQAVDVNIPAPAGRTPVLHRLHGSSCAVHDWLPFDEPLPEGKRIDFATRDGKSSLGASPFFYLEWEGGGVITAIGWSGQWGAAVEHPKGGPLHLQAGMQGLHTVLHPGESIRSPRILQLYSSGNDPYMPYQLFRQTMFAHVMPQRARRAGHAADRASQHLLLRAERQHRSRMSSRTWSRSGIWASSIFWLDAYWTRDGFPDGMGHYGFPLERVEPPDRFPRGLRPIGDAAHAAGHGFPGLVRARAGRRRHGPRPGASRVGDLADRSERPMVERAVQPGHPGGPGVHDALPDRSHRAPTASTACASTTTSTRCPYWQQSRRAGPGPRRHGRDPLRRRALPDVGRHPGGLPGPLHRQLRQRRPAHRPGDLCSLDPALADRCHHRAAVGPTTSTRPPCKTR